jgi:hypothetical protein
MRKTWYGTTGRWWSTCVKREIQRFFKTTGTEQAHDKKQQIDLYDSCIYDLLKQPTDFPDLNVNLRYYKAKIIQS